MSSLPLDAVLRREDPDARCSPLAVIVHKRSALLGSTTLSSHQLPLTRYSAPSFSLPAASWSSSSPTSSYSHLPSKPASPTPALRGLQYSIAANSGVLGPNDPLEVRLLFHRDDPSVFVKKVHVTLERHTDVDHSASSTVGSDDEEEVIVPDHDDRYSPPVLEDEGSSVTNGRSSSALKILTPWRRGNPGATSPLTSPTGVSDSGGYFGPRTSGGFEADSHLGSFGRAPVPILALELDDVPVGGEVVLSGVLPHAKSLFRYSVGETMRTNLVNVWFTVSVKVSHLSSICSPPCAHPSRNSRSRSSGPAE